MMTHILGLAVQTVSALASFLVFMGMWFTFKDQLEVIAEWGLTEETGLPLLAGIVTLLIGSLLYYLIAIGLLRSMGKLKAIGYQHLLVVGLIHGLILWPSILLLADLPERILPKFNDPMTQGLFALVVIGLAGAAVAAFIVSVYLLILRSKHAGMNR